MLRILAFVLVATGLLNCARTNESEGLDVKDKFLDDMAGVYSSEPNVPNKTGVPNDELAITAEGIYSMTQYWYLEYPHETCTLVSDEIDCLIEVKSTFCRVTDTGKINRVLELSVSKEDDQSLQAVTHIIEGMRSSSVLDDENIYGESTKTLEEDTPTPSSVLACREMVLRKNEAAGSQISRYQVNWPEDNTTLKFQHETAPSKTGVESLETTGTFVKN